jgi:predicted phage baseplate assembly protein
VYQGLSIGRRLIIEGELPTIPGPRLCEVVMLAGSEQRLDNVALAGGSPAGHGGRSRFRTVLTLAQPTTRIYRRDTVKIYGNVAAASEGASVQEVLGSGDGSRAWQNFTLKKPPLTYLSAATPTGAVSTLELTVNGVRWHEVGSLVAAGPEDRVFITETADDGVVTVRFGDGINGARLPSGTENVLANYRTGLGRGGNCQDGSITMLLSRPLGVRDVKNPLPASGGADPEDRDQGRRNAPVGVVALDRLVGIRDYQDFARAFAGIGKAEAVHLFDADGPAVMMTVAGRDGPSLRDGAGVLQTLQSALDEYGDPSHATIVKAARYLRVLLVASVALAPDYIWSATASRLRQALLSRFGYASRDLGQPLHRSEVLAAMHAVDGVAAVFIRVLASLPEPITQDMLNRLLADPPLADVVARPGRTGLDPAGTGQRVPLPADLAFMADDMPELMLLTEAVT